MLEKSFWRKEIRLFALLPALIIILIAGAFLFRNDIASSIINNNINASEMKADCLDFNLDWNLSVKITQLCLKHSMAEIEMKGARWDFWQNTLSINTLSVKHFSSNNDTNKNSSAQEQSLLTPSFEFLEKIPLLEIKQLIITSPLLDNSLNVKLKQSKTSSFQLLGDIEAEILFAEGKILAEVSWRVSDLIDYIPVVKKTITDYSHILDINTTEQITILSKMEFDGNKIQTANQIEFSNTLTLDNCSLPFNAIGDFTIDAKLTDLSADIDLSELNIATELTQCRTLAQIPELSDFKSLQLDIPEPLKFKDRSLTLGELNILIPEQPESSLTLRNFKLSTQNLISLDYVLVFKPILNANINYKKISLSSMGEIAIDKEHLQIQTQQNKFDIINTQDQRYAAQNISAAIDLQFSTTEGINGKGNVQSAQVKIGDSKIGKFTSTFKLRGPNFNELHLQAENQFNSISYPTPPTHVNKPKEVTKAPLKLLIKQLVSNIDFKLIDLKLFTVIGDTQLNGINVLTLPFVKTTINHQLQGNIADSTLTSSHNIVLSNIFSAKVEQQQRQFQINISEQKLVNFKSIFKAINPELKITEGLVSARLHGEVDSLTISGDFHFKSIFATFQDYQLLDLNYQNSLIFSSAGLQLAPSNITVDSIDTGIPIQNIKAALSASNNTFRLENVSGEIFGGRFSFDDIWLDGREQATEIELHDIELGKLVELQQQAGITVNGQIKGGLPLQFKNGGVSIDSGAVTSQGPGKLRIINNPAFDSIKAQQEDLAFLENMDFTQLSSKVKLNPDGWLFLDFSLIGDNPKKKQALKFNYNHQENILTLLKSLRLANSVQNKIEKSLIEGGKK